MFFSDVLVTVVFCGTFLMLVGQGHSICSDILVIVCFVKVYLRLDQPLAALEVRWDCGIRIFSQFSLSLQSNMFALNKSPLVRCIELALTLFQVRSHFW